MPVREFRAKLTHYLTAAQRGEVTVITSNGIPVGALVPLALVSPWSAAGTRSRC